VDDVIYFRNGVVTAIESTIDLRALRRHYLGDPRQGIQLDADATVVANVPLATG
jgi:hypothetical protein